MDFRNLLNSFGGSSDADQNPSQNDLSDTLGKLAGQLPSGLAGGAVAGGILSLIMTSKSARKVAGTAATYGGAALLGGLAYKAFKNWQMGQHEKLDVSEQSFTDEQILAPDFQLTLIKAMIGAARADGQIDATEQERIFDAVFKMDLSTETRSLVLDLLRHPVSIPEISRGAQTMEQKTEVYLISCMIIDIDHPQEKAWLDNLAAAMNLPVELAGQLENMAVEQKMAA